VAVLEKEGGLFAALLPFFYSLPLRTPSFRSPARLCASPLLVEFAFGLHRLVARDFASGVLNRALGPVWDWCTDNVPPPAAVPSSAKMPQAEQCALPKTSSASLRARALSEADKLTSNGRVELFARSGRTQPS
jgi:hypothetical protein